MSRLIASSIIAISLTIGSTAWAQQSIAPSKKSGQQEADQQTDQQQGGDMGGMLIKGLQAVDGCIAVKTCDWSDGKQSIVAWFKNKEAVETWYYSRTHQGMMRAMTDGSFEADEPMQHIENEDQPIMVIATLTPSDKMDLPNMKMPISQISIELFAALPGGAHVNGRASPDGFEVPHMKDYSPPSSDSESNGKATLKDDR